MPLWCKTVAGVPPVVPKGYRKHKVIVEGGDWGLGEISYLFVAIIWRIGITSRF
ncbi:MAG: hypothetical protein AAGE96_02905 [Cyanobacteria bacterium P01_G01_bin.19]